MNKIVCENCGHEFATIEEKSGVRSLIVHPPGMKLKVVSKESMKGELECPQCNHHTLVNLELFKFF